MHGVCAGAEPDADQRKFGEKFWKKSLSDLTTK